MTYCGNSRWFNGAGSEGGTRAVPGIRGCRRIKNGVLDMEKLTKTANGEAAVLAKIAAMPAHYRAMAGRLYELIPRSAPALQPSVWYGMPGYAKDGPVLCFFRADDQYMTFGLTEKASFTREENAPDHLMGCAWFFTALDDTSEARISAIVRRGASWRRFNRCS